MTFEELAELLAKSNRTAPQGGPSIRDYVKSQMDESKAAMQRPKESTMGQIFKLVGSLAPVAAGALMGGGEGAAIGAGVASQNLSADSARRQAQEDEADKYLKDRAGAFENMYIKSGLDAENAALQSDDKNKNLMTQILRDAAAANAAMEREKYKVSGAKDIAQMKMSAKRAQDAEKPAKMSKGQEKADTEFAKEYADWNAKGGYTSAIAAIDKIEKTILPQLKQDDESGHQFSGFFAKKQGLGEILSPKRRAILDNIVSVVGPTLRQINGTQFTEKESTQTIQSTFNTQLSDAENYRRLASLLKDMKTKAAEKDRASKYFEENGGTLSGYKATGSFAAPSQNRASKNVISQRDAEAMSDEDLRKYLEAGGEIEGL